MSSFASIFSTSSGIISEEKENRGWTVGLGGILAMLIVDDVDGADDDILGILLDLEVAISSLSSLDSGFDFG